MTFNLNDYVTARLAPHGYRVARLAGIDWSNDGTVRVQAWEFMRAFGPHLFNGCDQLFEGNLVTVENGEAVGK